MINKENIKLWVEALESGEYQQGRLQLCRNNKYCCLGVACEVFNKHNPGQLIIKESPDYNPQGRYYDESSTYLPKKVSGWLGLSEYDPIKEDLLSLDDDPSNITVKYLNTEYRVSYLNDAKMLSFPEIAKAIKETYL